MICKSTLNILLITDFFPYAFSEQFLETEVKYYKDCNVTIMPQHYKDTYRDIDNTNVKVDNLLIKKSTLLQKNKLLNTLKIFLSMYFIKEFLSQNLYVIKKLKSFRASMLHYYHYYNLFDNYFSSQNNLDNLIVYTYWNNEATYALQTLKQKYGYSLVSRIHGYDLYMERRNTSYMPLKSQFTHNIDKIFTITNTASEYLINKYNFSNKTLELSRLGVEDRNIISSFNKKNVLNIVSCSFLTEIKQVHKIPEALVVLAKKHPKINYKWTHIGDGELYLSTSNLAENLFTNLNNVEYSLVGRMDNENVYEYYKQNNIDVFINVSKSEGVPVSIMEAMSCHIPIIAPNIGGISDMVINETNGVLLSSKCYVNEIVAALEKVEYFKSERVRTGSYKIFLDNYNAKINYPLFIENLKFLTFSNKV